LTKKAKLDFDRKKQNYILTKNAQLRVDRKKIKKKIRRRTPYSRQPPPKSPHTKPQQAAVCVSTTVRRNERKKTRSLT
jgi:hypothetical protein